MRWVILDSGVYIDHWKGLLPPTWLENLRRAAIVRQSSVVLSELRRGARSPLARRIVGELHRKATEVWEPMAADWWEAGDLVRTIGDAQGWETGKRRGFQNDALIALTARRHGATVVTGNRTDFTLLAKKVQLSLRFP